MDIEGVVSGFVSVKVVVVGDVMVDEYMRGSVQGMSPETDVPLLLRSRLPTIDEDLVRLGGAGNTARNIASLGAEVVLIGVSGEADPASRQLKTLVANHDPNGNSRTPHSLKINCRIVSQGDLITTHKLRMLSNKSVQLFRVDTEATQVLKKETVVSVINEFRSVVAWCDVIVISDYAKGLITEDLFKQLRAICDGKPIIVDPKEVKEKQKLAKYYGADVVIPNEPELRKSFGWQESIGLLEELFSGDLQSSLGKVAIKAIVCTRGDKGILYSDSESDHGRPMKGKKVDVADVTGASDTVTAVVALAWAQNAGLEIASYIAEAAGRIKVTKRLTGTVYMNELLEALVPMFQKHARAKLHVEQSQLLESLREIREKKGADARTALVTGCFDILHRGHVRLLEWAAELAEIVVVAVNSDDYVRRTQHKIGGPYVDQISRATLIASLASVDLVTIFDEDTPENVIKQTRPNILVMGREYERSYLEGTLPAMREIERIGATVRFGEWPDTQGVSSSAIAERIRSS